MSTETITKLFQIHGTSWDAGGVPAQERCGLPPSPHTDSGDLGCPAVASKDTRRTIAVIRATEVKKKKKKQSSFQAYKAFCKSF